MSTAYRADIFTPTGIALPSAVPIEGDVVLTERGIGTLYLKFPASFPVSYLQKDGLIRLQRRVDAGSYATLEDATWLIRHRKQSLANREYFIEVWAEHANSLLQRRIVAYAAATSQASKNTYADDMAKAIVRENFTAPTDTTRTMSSFSVAADVSAGPTLSKAFSRQKVLKVLQELCDDAAAQGAYLGFEVRTIGTSLTFLTYTTYRGVDRRYGTGNYLRVSPSSGAITGSSLDEDWSDEETFVYALGKGEEAARVVGSAQNTVAEGASPYGRIEGTYQANQTDDVTVLNGLASAAVYARRGRVKYEATGQDVAGFRYGVDYHWGDLLTLSDFGQQFDVRVDPVQLSWSRDGEKVAPRFTYDNTGLAV